MSDLPILGIQNGVRYAYTGNVHDESGDSTYCHNCGGKIIGRDWTVLTDWKMLDKGFCRFCYELCSDAFEEKPGNWATKNLPVRLAPYRH